MLATLLIFPVRKIHHPNIQARSDILKFPRRTSSDSRLRCITRRKQPARSTSQKTVPIQKKPSKERDHLIRRLYLFVSKVHTLVVNLERSLNLSVFRHWAEANHNIFKIYPQPAMMRLKERSITTLIDWNTVLSCFFVLNGITKEKRKLSGLEPHRE